MKPVTQPASLFKLAIVGSRKYPLRHLVDRYVDRIPSDVISAIYSGFDPGVGAWAAKRARLSGFPVHEFFSDWTLDGRRARFVRNHRLVDAVDQVVAFWDGSSSGTAHAIQLARLAGKLRRVFGPDGRQMSFDRPPHESLCVAHPPDPRDCPSPAPPKPVAPPVARPERKRVFGYDGFDVVARAAHEANRHFVILSGGAAPA